MFMKKLHLIILHVASLQRKSAPARLTLKDNFRPRRLHLSLNFRIGIAADMASMKRKNYLNYSFIHYLRYILNCSDAFAYIERHMCRIIYNRI